MLILICMTVRGVDGLILLSRFVSQCCCPQQLRQYNSHYPLSLKVSLTLNHPALTNSANIWNITLSSLDSFYIIEKIAATTSVAKIQILYCRIQPSRLWQQNETEQEVREWTGGRATEEKQLDCYCALSWCSSRDRLMWVWKASRPNFSSKKRECGKIKAGHAYPYNTALS